MGCEVVMVAVLQHHGCCGGGGSSILVLMMEAAGDGCGIHSNSESGSGGRCYC